MFNFLTITDEQTEAIIADDWAKFTEKVAKPGLEPVSLCLHFAIPHSLYHF